MDRGRLRIDGAVAREVGTTCVAVVAPLAATLALVPFREALSGATLAMVVAVVVVGVAAWGRRAVAYVAAVTGALAFDLLLTEPFGSFAIYHGDNVVAAVCLFLLGAVVGEVASRSRARAVEVVRREEEFGRLYYAAELAARDTPMRVLVDTVGRELHDLLGLDAWLWDDAPVAGDQVATIERSGRVLVGTVEWPVHEAGLPRGANLLVIHDDRPVGAFVLEPTVGRAVTRRELLVAVSLADQVGAAYRAEDAERS